jgi:DNA polymerase-3 subunit delta
MIIKPYDIESFIKNIQSDTTQKLIILYGQDLGLIEERTKILIKRFFINSTQDITEFYADDLKKDESLLTTAAYTYSMLQEDNKKVILIKEGKDFLTSILNNYLKKIDKDTLIIINTLELPKNSSLRMLGENSNQTAIVPCYFDDSTTLQKLISLNLKKHDFNFNKDVLDYLVANLGNNRSVTLQELKKLKLYTYKTKTITITDVKNIIEDNANQNTDDLINSIFLNKQNLIYQNFKQYENLVTTNFVRYLINHTNRLLFIKFEIKNKETLQNALKKLKPPVFFNQLENFKKQLNMYTLKDLQNILKNLTLTELSLRENPNIANTLLQNICHNINTHT